MKGGPGVSPNEKPTGPLNSSANLRETPTTMVHVKLSPAFASVPADDHDRRARGPGK